MTLSAAFRKHKTLALELAQGRHRLRQLVSAARDALPYARSALAAVNKREPAAFTRLEALLSLIEEEDLK